VNKQNICIIGGSLTGLVTAISLSKIGCKVDLIVNNSKNNNKSKRTIAISENNLNFINKLGIAKSLKNQLWPCSQMKLYAELKNNNFSEVFDFSNKFKKKNIFYIIENTKIMQTMTKKIKKNKNISILKNSHVSEINNSGSLKSIKLNKKIFKYNLIIICAGSNSNLIKKIFTNETIEDSYKETSIVTILKHKSLKNKITRQIFLKDGILALLPISNTQTSIVWSIKKNFKIKDDFFFKNKIKHHVGNYLKNVKFISKLEYKDLNFLVRKKYHKDRILLFGDALHVIHPFVGQGFNMTLRDLSSLERILKSKVNLGLDIGGADILSEFSQETKPRNFAFSMGVNFLKNSFSIKNENFKNARNQVIKKLNKNNFFKNFLFNIADKGLKL
jgi:2-octaprenyl-6-methoxyphenol hydroxylase